ncbi:MAG: SusC/RagA family TonB-linked outer membrane protein [Bacteroidales bacterium]|nr:SusC/RagA family TonB-linked outer membrane protein [Bacteroidales bacterium]
MHLKHFISTAALALVLCFSANAQTDTTSSGSHTVTRDRMNKGLVTGGLDALNGQSAGVVITSGANRAAMLDAVRVRGTTSLTGGNDPLVIIDGVASDISTLGTLYPGDIESFTVLKDASETSRYGSRGASGVIKVDTRKGKGGAFSLSYDGISGIESVCKNLDMLDAEGFRAYNRANGYSIIDKGANSYMPGSILRTGTVENHHISFGGGTDESRYRASFGLTDHKTVVKTNRYRTYTAKLDINQGAFDGLLDFDLGVFGSLKKSSDLHDIQHLFYSSAAFNPTFPIGAEADGSYSQIPEASQINNPSSLLEKQFDSDNAHFNAHLQASIHLLKNLELSAFGSYSYNVTEDAHFFPTIVWSHGEAYRGHTRSQDFLGDINLKYTFEAGPHHLELTGLTEALQTVSDGSFATTTGFTTNIFGYDAIQAGALRPWDGTASFFEDVGLLSFMGGANYSYSEKYLLALSIRSDASSKFGPNNRWGYFPSASFTWAAIKEPFLRDLGWLSNLKFTVGYGLSGNQGALGAYNSMSLLRPTGIVNMNGTPTTSFGIVRNANPDLKWEVRSSGNVGLESGFIDNRLVFTAEVYSSLTRDMLYEYEVSVPPFAYNRLMANLGKMSNAGAEFGLGGTPLHNKDMELNINVNLSFQHNKLISLSGWYKGEYLTAPDIAGLNALNGAGFHGGHNDIVHQIVGQPLGVFFLPHCTGLAQAEDGSWYYEMADGEDNRIAGQATPKATLGSNISFRWKDFDISLQMNGAFGHKIFNGTALTYMNLESLPYYNVFSSAPAKGIKDQTVTDYWLEKGDYLNFDYLTVGWNVPIRSSVIHNFRISASVNNLATITGYSGLTPMINSSVVNSTFGLDDKVSFPVYRSYTLGLNIQF